MYPDPRVVDFIQQHFVPVRVHVRQQAADFKRLGAQYDAQWTPTLLVIDESGEARHRVEGFLPVEDLIAQLNLGLGHSAFKRSQFGEAERLFRLVLQEHPDTDAAAEAQYWAGVARYKQSGDGAALAETARQFRERYRDTAWAKKASVWEPAAP